MQKTPPEPIHTRFVPDRTHIISDINSRRDNILETLEDAIAHNTAHPDAKILLDAYEEGQFIERCARAIDTLDKTDTQRAQELGHGLLKMLDKTGKEFFEVNCDVVRILHQS